MSNIVEGLSIEFVLFCAILGIIGQAFRTLVGLYKLKVNPDKDFRVNFSIGRLLITLITGAFIGGIISLIYDSPISKGEILGIIGFSYAGTDSLEGLLKQKINMKGMKNVSE